MKALTSAATTASFTAPTQKFASKKITTKFSGYAKHGRVIDVKATPYLTTSNMHGTVQLRFRQVEIVDMVKYLLSKHFDVKLSAVKAAYNTGYDDNCITARGLNEQGVKFFVKNALDGIRIGEDMFELTVSELTNSACELVVRPISRRLVGFLDADGKEIKEDALFGNDLFMELEYGQKSPFEITIS